MANHATFEYGLESKSAYILVDGSEYLTAIDLSDFQTKSFRKSNISRFQIIQANLNVVWLDKKAQRPTNKPYDIHKTGEQILYVFVDIHQKIGTKPKSERNRRIDASELAELLKMCQDA